MKIAVFQINNRFIVDGNKNQIWDTKNKQETKLEPRLMKLLCLLARQSGELITREYLIKEIWNEYPGANEGLNQAISFLRKQLEDDNKLMIKTIPKSGYSFHATISWEPENISAHKKEGLTRRMVGISLMLGILLLLILYSMPIHRPVLLSEDVITKSHAEISRLDSIHQSKTMQKLSNGKVNP